MGDCVHCGKPAGFFKSAHPECRTAYQAEMTAKAEAEDRRTAESEQFSRDLNAAVANHSVSLVAVDEMVARALEAGVIDLQDRSRLLSSAWSYAVERFLLDDLLTDQEEERVLGFIERFSLSAAELNKDGLLSRLQKVGVLKLLVNGGELPAVTTSVPINLQKTERLLWIENDVRMLEDKVRRETVGRSQGVSVRVVSGVYVRLGAFKGKPVFSTERVEVGVGTLYVTDKNLYFYSRAQSVRIPYGKIVSFEQFSDGLGFMRDAASAKPQFFINGDGWFLYNLITNLAYRD